MKRQEWRQRKKRTNRKLPVTLAVTALLGSSILPASGVIAEGLTDTSSESKTELIQSEEIQLEKQLDPPSIPLKASLEEPTRSPENVTESSTEGSTRSSSDESTESSGTEESSTEGTESTEESTEESIEKTYATPEEVSMLRALVDFDDALVEADYTPESWNQANNNGMNGRSYVKHTRDILADPNHEYDRYTPEDIESNYEIGFKRLLVKVGSEGQETGDDLTAGADWAGIIDEQGSQFLAFTYNIYSKDGTINQDTVADTIKVEVNATSPIEAVRHVPGGGLYKETLSGNSASLDASNIVAYGGMIVVVVDDPYKLEGANLTVTINGKIVLTMSYEGEGNIVSPESISIVGPKEVKKGKNIELNANLSPQGVGESFYDNIIWSTNNGNINLSPQGRKVTVTGAEAGEAVITATTSNGKVATHTVKVTEDQDPIEPSKLDVSKLEAAIKTAESKEESKFTVKSWQAANFKEVLPVAKDVLTKAKDQNAKAKAAITQADVDAQTKAVNDSIAKLVLKTDDGKDDGNGGKDDGKNDGKDDGKGKGDGNGSGVGNKKDSNVKNKGLANISNKSNTQVNKNNTGLPQTGEAKLVMTSLIGLEIVLVCGVIYLVRKRKESV